MKVELDNTDLAQLIRQIVAEVRDQDEAKQARLNGRLAYPEPEAAALLGVQPHVLRDCRLRGEIQAVKCGKRLLYSREALQRFLGEDSGQERQRRK